MELTAITFIATQTTNEFGFVEMVSWNRETNTVTTKTEGREFIFHEKNGEIKCQQVIGGMYTDTLLSIAFQNHANILLKKHDYLRSES